MNLPGELAVVFLMSAGMCMLLGRVIIPWLARAQGTAPARYEDCPPLLAYQETKRTVPTMGGLFVLASGIAVAAASGGLARREGWVVLGALASFAAVGLFDDCLKFRGPNAVGLRTWPKLAVALAIGAGVGIGSSGSGGFSTVELPWLRRSVDLGWAWVPFAALVVGGSAHAVNLTDGMDGLAAGCTAIAVAAVGLLALERHPEDRMLALWCISLAGACLGFLWFNAFPASVFLGDVGALGLGGALGTLSVLSRTALWLPIIGGIFLIEALSVMLQVASYKWRGKRRIFRVAPIHHHFHLGGVNEPKLIVRFWVVAVVLAALGLTAPGPR